MVPPRGDRTDPRSALQEEAFSGMTPEGPANCEVPLAVRGLPSHDRSRGNNRPSFTPAGPGRSSKPHSGSGSIRLRALLDGQGNTSHRRSGLASGEAAVSPYPDGTSGASPSPYHRAVSLLLRSSDSRPSGSHPTPCSPKWGLSSAAGRCRRGPPSAALCLLASGRGRCGGNNLPLRRGRRKSSRAVAFA